MSSPRHRQKFREQLQLLQLSCNSYDGGFEIEAYRIAVALRVLFHSTPTSRSIIDHLKMNGAKMLSSTDGRGMWEHFVKVNINLRSGTPVRCLPLLGPKFNVVPFFEWWNAQPAYTFEGRKYTRRNIILEAANSDGGAHVNTTLARFYQDLADGTQGLGIVSEDLTYNGVPPFDLSKTHYAPNTHLAILRQFGHETLCSVSHFKWLE